MAIIVEHIDKIAREKQRDVLFVAFEGEKFKHRRYQTYKERDEFIEYLQNNYINYDVCDYAARDDVWWDGYRGQLYIDVPFDKENEQYRLLERYLENEDGTPKMEGGMFYYLPLEIAMKNAHHDEPGYWEKRAEDF